MAPSALRELQHEIETQANLLSKLQKDTTKNHQVRKQYTIQLGENELVLKELDLLNENANIYKLIGPVLVRQDLAEANANVRKRIEYISAELKRLDGTLQGLEEQQHEKREADLLSNPVGVQNVSAQPKGIDLYSIVVMLVTFNYNSFTGQLVKLQKWNHFVSKYTKRQKPWLKQYIKEDKNGVSHPHQQKRGKAPFETALKGIYAASKVVPRSH
ncbi:hypothetical protein AMTR_s00066p00019590 [Amborella trichopoda]|uniref:Prefoldin subunit 6 n=1 Tax=Amborella trichopoda TaxID=13333 RepID=U5D3C9_AMBTC|nr:hypothetical protein AMTR_s00066p00019590 [Amborella trichopoda]